MMSLLQRISRTICQHRTIKQGHIFERNWHKRQIAPNTNSYSTVKNGYLSEKASNKGTPNICKARDSIFEDHHLNACNKFIFRGDIDRISVTHTGIHIGIRVKYMLNSRVNKPLYQIYYRWRDFDHLPILINSLEYGDNVTAYARLTENNGPLMRLHGYYLEKHEIPDDETVDSPS